MAEKLTPQQKVAVEDRGGKLLVSAAAGSGKTKTLIILIELIKSHKITYINKCRVTGVTDSLSKTLCTMSCILMTTDVIVAYLL